MFDISWTEFLLIGVVALIVIGPKELPGVLRTLGQWTRKVRGMAADFQNQFQEAMREAEMADLKKEVDDLAHDFKNFDPLKGVRDGVEAAGRDIERSLDGAPAQKADSPVAGEPAVTEAQSQPPAAAPQLTSAPAVESAVPVGPVERSDLETVGADVTTKSTEPAAAAAPPDSTGRSG
jgi:sec-independent protein translocase protein TatB